MDFAQAVTDPSTYYFTQGVLGVTVVVLAYVCIKLYGKTEKLQARIEELQELRLLDSKELTKNVTEVLQSNSQSLNVLSEKIEIVRGIKDAPIQR